MTDLGAMDRLAIRDRLPFVLDEGCALCDPGMENQPLSIPFSLVGVTTPL